MQVSLYTCRAHRVSHTPIQSCKPCSPRKGSLSIRRHGISPRPATPKISLRPLTVFDPDIHPSLHRDLGELLPLCASTSMAPLGANQSPSNQQAPSWRKTFSALVSGLRALAIGCWIKRQVSWGRGGRGAFPFLGATGGRFLSPSYPDYGHLLMGAA
jgi:hypothetical protein